MKVKKDRLELDVSAVLKQELRRKANAAGLTLHDFVIGVLREAIDKPLLKKPVNKLREQLVDVSEPTISIEPWEWMLKLVLTDIKAGQFNYPHCFEVIKSKDGVETLCLVIGTRHFIDHINNNSEYAKFCASFPDRSVVALNKRIKEAGFFVKGDMERVIAGTRTAHMIALSVAGLAYLCKLPN
jgi:hypothetical protein